MFRELRPLQNERFSKGLFDDSRAKKLDDGIARIVTQITKSIKGAELQLREMEALGQERENDSSTSLSDAHFGKSKQDNRAS